MEKKRIVSVRELVEMFVAISYLQEVRIFKFDDICNYIRNCYNNKNIEYDATDLDELLYEAEDTIGDLLYDDVISYVYPEACYGMYKVNDKIDFIEISKYSKEYLKDMNKVFYAIHGGEPKNVKLTLSETKKNNR